MLPSKTHLAALGQVVEGIGQVVVVIRHLLGSGGRRRGAFRDSRAPLGWVPTCTSPLTWRPCGLSWSFHWDVPSKRKKDLHTSDNCILWFRWRVIAVGVEIPGTV